LIYNKKSIAFLAHRDLVQVETAITSNTARGGGRGGSGKEGIGIGNFVWKLSVIFIS